MGKSEQGNSHVALFYQGAALLYTQVIPNDCKGVR